MKILFLSRAITLLYLFFFTQLAMAQEYKVSAISDDEIALLSMLEEETALAITEHVNADYLPGMISILHGDDLLSQGVKTVFEALSLVPGIQVSRGGSGSMILTIRGMRHAVFGGNALIMLNSIPTMTSTRAEGNSTLALPISQVDRIEITRGSGSILHGEYASTGVINVITHKYDNNIHLGLASFDSQSITANFSWQEKQSNLHVFSNISLWNITGARVNSGPDSLASRGDISYAPGPVDDRERLSSVLLGVDVNNFFADISWEEYNVGNFHGLRVLSPLDNKIGTEKRLSLNLMQKINHKKDLTASLQFNLMQIKFNSSERTEVPAGNIFRGPPPPPGSSPPAQGLLVVDDLTKIKSDSELRYDLAATLNWKGWNKQHVRTGFKFSKIKLYANSLTSNFSRRPLAIYTGLQTFRDFDASRRIHSFFIEDRFSYWKNIELTASLRHDNYSDVGSYTSPRFAAIWQYKPAHALKAQYTESIRPPTFNELYASPIIGGVPMRDLTIQVTKSSELGYIYRHIDKVLRLTLFNNKIINPTNLGPFQVSVSGQPIRLKGVEIEVESALGRQWKINGNFSYLNSYDESRATKLGGAYSWLANVLLKWKVNSRWQINMRLRAVSEQINAIARFDPVDSYTTFDLSLTNNQLFNIKGFMLRMGVNNLFDDEIRFTTIPIDYAEGLPQPGRSVWLQSSYEF